MFVWKRPKINEKEAGVGPFFKKKSFPAKKYKIISFTFLSLMKTAIVVICRVFVCRVFCYFFWWKKLQRPLSLSLSLFLSLQVINNFNELKLPNSQLGFFGFWHTIAEWAEQRGKFEILSECTVVSGDGLSSVPKRGLDRLDRLQFITRCRRRRRRRSIYSLANDEI